MIRRLNFTGRRTIPRSRITIRLEAAAYGVHRYSAEYDLKRLRFPSDACVYIEAYNAVSYMRFDFGTVRDVRLPRSTRLAEVTPHPRPRFRLKVVDRPAGLLLGVADPIIPLRAEDDAAHRQPLLPVDFCDLGERAPSRDGMRVETSIMTPSSAFSRRCVSTENTLAIGTLGQRAVLLVNHFFSTDALAAALLQHVELTVTESCIAPQRFRLVRRGVVAILSCLSPPGISH